MFYLNSLHVLRSMHKIEIKTSLMLISLALSIKQDSLAWALISYKVTLYVDIMRLDVTFKTENSFATPQ